MGCVRLNRLGLDRLRLRYGLLGLWPDIVVCDLHANLSGILALEGQVAPQVVLSSAGNNDIPEVDPCLSNEVRLLIVVKHRHLELVVVWGIVDGESKLLVPAE